MTKLDRSLLWCEAEKLQMGLVQFTCYSREVTTPVGIAWVQRFGANTDPGNSKLRRTYLLNISTVHHYQRNGVATKLHEMIFENYCDCVVTQSGSKTGGLALIKALGYKMEKLSGLWVLTKAAFEKRNK